MELKVSETIIGFQDDHTKLHCPLILNVLNSITVVQYTHSPKLQKQSEKR